MGHLEEASITDYLLFRMRHALPQYDWLRVMFDWVWPALLGVGVIGNLVILTTVFCTEFRGRQYGLSISMLALADLSSLIYSAISLSNSHGDSMAEYSRIMCKLSNYFFNVTDQVSSWTVVLLTYERVVYVMVSTSRARALLSRRNILSVWAGLIVAILAVNVTAFVWYDLTGREGVLPVLCVIRAPYTATVAWYFALQSCLIPLAAIIAGNVVILIRIQILRRRIARIHQDEAERVRNQVEKQRNLTAVMLVVSTLYELLTVPQGVHLLLLQSGFLDRVFASIRPLETELNFMLYWTVINILYNLNSVTNFVLYTVLGEDFRRVLVAVVLYLCRAGCRGARGAGRGEGGLEMQAVPQESGTPPAGPQGPSQQGMEAAPKPGP